MSMLEMMSWMSLSSPQQNLTTIASPWSYLACSINSLKLSTFSLIAFFSFLFGYGKSGFILWAELSDKGHLEFFPGIEFQLSILDSVSDDTLGKGCVPVGQAQSSCMKLPGAQKTAFSSSANWCSYVHR
jgi:hypothetical protein